MKVKIFSCSAADILEKAINNFIKDKKIIDIKFSSVHYFTEYNEKGLFINGEINDRVLVIYEEMSPDTFTLTKNEVKALNRYVKECLCGGDPVEKE